MYRTVSRLCNGNISRVTDLQIRNDNIWYRCSTETRSYIYMRIRSGRILLLYNHGIRYSSISIDWYENCWAHIYPPSLTMISKQAISIPHVFQTQERESWLPALFFSSSAIEVLLAEQQRLQLRHGTSSRLRNSTCERGKRIKRVVDRKVKTYTAHSKCTSDTRKINNNERIS